MLTANQKKVYLKNVAVKCPYCGSGDITGSQIDVEGNSAIQEVTCDNCDARWHDVYKLVDVLEDKAPENNEDRLANVLKRIISTCRETPEIPVAQRVSNIAEQALNRYNRYDALVGGPEKNGLKHAKR